MGAGALSLPSRVVLADLVATSRVRAVAVVGGFVLALAAGAQVAIPLPGTPVPITLQTFVVLLGAVALGPGRAVTGVVAYVGLGLVGVPWLAVVGGATSGYLVGFVVAAAIVGGVARTGAGRAVRSAAGLMVLGNVVIHALGVASLMLVVGLDLPAAIAAGTVPFLLGDAVKLAAATVLLPAAWKWADRTRR